MPTIRKVTTEIFVHCSDSAWGNASVIDQWHKERGWEGIGYHAVVLNGKVGPKSPYHADLDGVIQQGRNEQFKGSHVLGHNSVSLGICHIGSPSSPCTPNQWAAMVDKVSEWCTKYGVSPDNVYGHCEKDSDKPLCPGIDMDKFRNDVRVNLL